MTKNFCLIFICYSLFLYSIDPSFLTLPPFWDSILAIFKEAFWLLDNKWNFNALMFSEPGYSNNGARTYLFSIYPSIVALTFKITNSTQSALVLLHLMTILTSSLCLLFLYTVGLSLFNDKNVATGVAILLGISPLFTAQSLALNMEIPLACCVAACTYYLTRQSDNKAIFVAYLACAIKSPGGLVGAALFCVYCIEYFTFPSKKVLLKAAVSVLPVIAALAQRYLENHIFYLGGSDGQICSSALNHPLNFIMMLFYLLPSTYRDPCIASSVVSTMPITTLLLFYITLALIVYGIVQSIHPLMHIEKIYADNRNKFVHFRVLLFLSCYAAVTYLFINMYSITLPRYLTAPLVALVLIGAIVINHLFSGKTPYVIGLVLAAYFLLVDYSLIGLKKLSPYINYGHIIEQTPSYTSVIKRDLRFFTTLKKYSSKHTLFVTTWPYKHMLSDPRYGYVTNAFKTLSTFRTQPIDLSNASSQGKRFQLVTVLMREMFFPTIDLSRLSNTKNSNKTKTLLGLKANRINIRANANKEVKIIGSMYLPTKDRIRYQRRLSRLLKSSLLNY